MSRFIIAVFLGDWLALPENSLFCWCFRGTVSGRFKPGVHVLSHGLYNAAADRMTVI